MLLVAAHQVPANLLLLLLRVDHDSVVRAVSLVDGRDAVAPLGCGGKSGRAAARALAVLLVQLALALLGAEFALVNNRSAVVADNGGLANAVRARRICFLVHLLEYANNLVVARVLVNVLER